MSITSDLLDRIEPFVGSWSRSTGVNSLIQLLQDGQDELFDCEAAGMIWKGTDNKGFPPYLITVDGTYQYRVSAANLSNVSSITKTINGTSYAVRPKIVTRVFVDTNTTFDYSRSRVSEPYAISYYSPWRSSNDRLEIAEILLDSEPLLENDLPLLNFRSNPGASTDVYFVEFTWEPMRLTSETIPVCVPTKFYQALIDYVIGRVSQLDNGKENERLSRFYNGYDRGTDWVPSWKEQFSAYYDAGAQAESAQVIPLW